MPKISIRSAAAAVAVLASPLAGCVTDEPAGPSFATGLDVPETDGVLIEWRKCEAKTPCMHGEWSGEPYKLGFEESPALVTGHLGAKPVRLALDAGSVTRLGDHAIEMTFRDPATRARLAVTWNELAQKPIDARLVIEDAP
jgi:hypothetical protein